MSAAPNPVQPHPQPGGLAPRDTLRTWILFRLVLGVAGAAFVIFPITAGNSYLLSIAGLVMFVVAILLPPARPQSKEVAKAHELGAVAVADGGRIRFKDAASSIRVKLFAAPERVFVLDHDLRSLFEIPACEITSAIALRKEDRWILEVKWADYCANFFYRGFSAERRGHQAESAVRRVMHPMVPVTAQGRAASA